MSGVHRGKQFTVPELEAAPAPGTRPWTEEETKIVGMYYGKKDAKSIVAYLKKKYPTGRTRNAIRSKAYALKADGG